MTTGFSATKWLNQTWLNSTKLQEIRFETESCYWCKRYISQWNRKKVYKRRSESLSRSLLRVGEKKNHVLGTHFRQFSHNKQRNAFVPFLRFNILFLFLRENVLRPIARGFFGFPSSRRKSFDDEKNNFLRFASRHRSETEKIWYYEENN